MLGVRWNNSADQLAMDLKEIASTAALLNPTKRAIVSLVGRFYNPLGLLSPVVIQFKILLQEMCGMKMGPTTEWRIIAEVAPVGLQFTGEADVCNPPILLGWYH